MSYRSPVRKAANWWLIFAVLVGGLLAGWWLARVTPAGNETSAELPYVPIEDGMTIDFSDGTPAILDSEEDREALEEAKRAMEEATRGTVFGPAPDSGEN